MAVRASDVTIENTVFDGAGNPDARPFSTSGVVTGLDVSDNFFTNWDNGIYIVNGHSGSIANNEFDGNGNGVLTESIAMIVSGNTFQNSVGVHVGVLPFAAIADVSSYILADNIFLDQDRPVSIYPNNAGGMTVTGSVFADTFRGTDPTLLGNQGLSPGPFTVDTGAGADRIFGSNLGDAITGGADDDEIDGADGTDTAFFSGNRAQYVVTPVGLDIVVEDLRPGSPDGTDTVTDVENFQFADVLQDDTAGLNDPPTAQNDDVAGDEDEDIVGLAVATDPDDAANTLTFALVGANGGAANGTVVMNPDGSFTYTPIRASSGTTASTSRPPSGRRHQQRGDRQRRGECSRRQCAGGRAD